MEKTQYSEDPAYGCCSVTVGHDFCSSSGNLRTAICWKSSVEGEGPASKFNVSEHAGPIHPAVLIYVSGMPGSLLGSAVGTETYMLSARMDSEVI